MNGSAGEIQADAIALQERDSFREQGWLKLISPAKVNLHLAIGSPRPDGLHEAENIMHCLALHDVVYMRLVKPGNRGQGPNEADCPAVHMVPQGDIETPSIDAADNLASQAVRSLADASGHAAEEVEIRIEKSIPLQGGLGGGSSNAAAALIGAAQLWGLDS